MSVFITQVFPVAVLILYTGTNAFVTVRTLPPLDQLDDSILSIDSSETATLPASVEADNKDISLTGEYHNSEIYGNTDAEQLSDLSIVDALFRKRRNEDCNGIYGIAYEGPVVAKESPTEGKESPVKEEESPVGEEEKFVEAKESPVGGEESLVEAKESPVGGEETLVEANKSPVVGEESLVEAKESPVGGEETVDEGKESPVGGEGTSAEAKESPVGGEKATAEAQGSQVSVEELELVSYEEISSGESKEESGSNPPVVDYLTPPAEGAKCTTFVENSSVEKTTDEPESQNETTDKQGE